MKQTDELEEAFGKFIDGMNYDRAEEALFSIVRAAFLAGWKAASGSEAIDTAQK